VRWNGLVAGQGYAALLGSPRRRSRDAEAPETLARRLEDFAVAGGLPARLSDVGVKEEALAELADLAAEQWTGTFNPRPFDAAGAVEIYEAAF
jgi:alcohol dehydrogenase